MKIIDKKILKIYVKNNYVNIDTNTTRYYVIYSKFIKKKITNKDRINPILFLSKE